MTIFRRQALAMRLHEYLHNTHGRPLPGGESWWWLLRESFVRLLGVLGGSIVKVPYTTLWARSLQNKTIRTKQ